MEAETCATGCQTFRLGDWLVEPTLNLVSRGAKQVRLRPKVMDVLLAMAQTEAGQIVRKQDLLDKVWPRDAVPDSVLTRAVFELRQAFGDDPRDAHVVATVSRRGYRLLLPVTPVAGPGRAPRVARAACEPAGLRPAALAGSRRALAFLALAMAVTVACLEAGHGTTLGACPGGAPGSWLGVLPFAEEGTPEDPLLAAGIGDELAGRLAGRSPFTVVVPRREAGAVGPGRNLQGLGRRLGVGRVLTGTIVWPPVPGVPLRVEVRVVCVASGVVEWRGTYSVAVDRPLAMQGTIASALAEELLASSAKLAAAAAVPDAVPLA